MPDAYLVPYISFDGNAREAMEFYNRVLGGQLELNTFGQTMPDGTPPEYMDKIMHGVITNDALTFMGADSPPGTDYKAGGAISLSLAGTDAAKLKQFWDGLSAGGKITVPMAKQVWGDEFGMFTDKFGINWLINITAG